MALAPEAARISSKHAHTASITTCKASGLNHLIFISGVFESAELEQVHVYLVRLGQWSQPAGSHRKAIHAPEEPALSTEQWIPDLNAV